MFMHDIICSDIRFDELRLKRIKLEKEYLLDNKPFILERKKLIKWQKELKKLEEKEKQIQAELENSFIDLEKYI